MSENLSKPWLEVSSAIDAVKQSLSSALREQHDFEKGTGELAKATAAFKQVAMGVGIQLAKTNSVSREQARNFYDAARAVRDAAKAAREMEIRYKGMQMAAMSFGDVVMASTDKVVGFANSIQKLAGIGVAGGVGLKTLTDANLAFKRSLFESDKIASRYGESIGSLKRAFQTIRSTTEMSQQDFSNLNKTLKELYLGIPPTSQAIAKMVQELRGRVGYSDDVISKTLEGLVGLQTKVPQIMEAVTAAWDAAAKGQGDAANKMALQMRLLLSQSGATRGEIEKVMAAMEPRNSTGRSPFLDFEKGMAKAEQRAKDAQLSLAIKLEPTLNAINYALTKLADILSGEVSGGFANVLAGVTALALPVATGIKGVVGLTNAYKALSVAMAIRGKGAASLFGIGAGGTEAAGMGGGAAVGAMSRIGGGALLAAGVGASAYAGWNEYKRRKEMGEKGPGLYANAGLRSGASILGGIGAAALTGLVTKNATATRLAFAAGSAGTAAWLSRKDSKLPTEKEPEDEESMRRIQIYTDQRKEQTELLAAQAGLFSDNYAGGAKEVRKLLQTEEGINKVRDKAIQRQMEGKTLSERILYAETELRKGTIARSEAITLIAGKEKDLATATKEVERISKSLVDVDRQRYEHSTQIISAMEKQISIFDQLSETGTKTVDGLAQSIAKLQGEGLFRGGFGETFENAVKSQEAVVEATSKKMQAVLFKNLAGRGEIKDLDVFINLRDDKVKEQVEAARKGLKESLSKEDSLTVSIQGKMAEIPRTNMESPEGKTLISQIEGLKSELEAAQASSKGFNDTLMGLANVLPNADNLQKKLSELNKEQQDFRASGGDIKDVKYTALVTQINEISKAYEEVILANKKLMDVRAQKAESSEKAMLTNNEKAIQLSKQRISLSESMNMGMARTWKYTKETVALQERQLQLLTQQSERYGQNMQEAANQAGIKLDFNFADADLEGFLADVEKKVRGTNLGLDRQNEIIGSITTQAHRRLDVEGKILQTTGEIMEATKQMREGWLEAVQGSMMGFGDMEKIIGTQDKSVTQLLKYGAPATYKYGGFMDHRPTELTRPPEYSDIYGAFRNTNPNANPFPQTDLEKSTGVRNIPYGQYGWDDVTALKRQALFQAQNGGAAQNTGMLMTMGTAEQDFGMQGIQQASINTATSLNEVGPAANQVRDALIELAGMVNQAQSGPAGRVPGSMVSVPWVQGVQPSNNWGPEGAGTAIGVSNGSSYLPLSQTTIPQIGVDKGNHKHGGIIKRYGYGGTLEAGSYIVSEGPSRVNADLLSQIPGVRYAARGGEVGDTRAGHDSIYYDVAGYGTGGAVLMPGETIIPPEFAHLGPSVNHYAHGGKVDKITKFLSVLLGGTALGVGGAWGGIAKNTTTKALEEIAETGLSYGSIFGKEAGKTYGFAIEEIAARKLATSTAKKEIAKLITQKAEERAAKEASQTIARSGLLKRFLPGLRSASNYGFRAQGFAGGLIHHAGGMFLWSEAAKTANFAKKAGVFSGDFKAVGNKLDIQGEGSLNDPNSIYADFVRESNANNTNITSFKGMLEHPKDALKQTWTNAKYLREALSIGTQQLVMDLTGATALQSENEAWNRTVDLKKSIRNREKREIEFKKQQANPKTRKYTAFTKWGGADKSEIASVANKYLLASQLNQGMELSRRHILVLKHQQEYRDYLIALAAEVSGRGRGAFDDDLKIHKEKNPEIWKKQILKFGNITMAEADYAKQKINQVKKTVKNYSTASPQQALSLGYLKGPYADGQNLPTPPSWMESTRTSIAKNWIENKPEDPDPAQAFIDGRAEVKRLRRLAREGVKITPPEFKNMPSAAGFSKEFDNSERKLTNTEKNEFRRRAYELTKPNITGAEVRYVGSYGKAFQRGDVGDGFSGKDSSAFLGSTSGGGSIVPVTRTISVPKGHPLASSNKSVQEKKMARGGFIDGVRRFSLGGWAGSRKPNSGGGSMGRRSSERMNSFMDSNGIQGPRSIPFHSQMNNGQMGLGGFRHWSGAVKPANMRGLFGQLSGSMKDRSDARMNYQLMQTARAGYNVGNQRISTAPQKNTPVGHDGAARVITVKVDASNALKDLATFEDANSLKLNRLGIT